MTIIADHFDVLTRDWLLSHGVGVAVIVVGALVVLTLAKFSVRRMQRRLEGAETETQELRIQRITTLTQAVSYLVRVAVWTVTVLLVLGQFDIDIGPLIAGAGIAGVALGFGAQSLVKDFLSGFFFLLEDQFGVGDRVTLAAAGKDVKGRVKSLSLRTTEIRDEEDTVHVVPNGNITVVANHSRPSATRVAERR